MRLSILDHGHGLGTKILFGLIRVVSRQPVLDVMKLVKYRSDFYGEPMQNVTHEAMRGDSEWSVGDRELMAAFIAKANGSEWCIQAHTAVAGRAYGNTERVTATLSDIDAECVEEPLRATLRLLRKLTLEQTVTKDDMQLVLAAGASRAQVEDALAVCFSLNTIARLADTFGFSVPAPEAFQAGAKYLLARGYR